MRLHTVALPVVLVAAVVLSSVSSRCSEPAPAKNFTLRDSAGKDWSLHDQKAKVVVVAFLALECPMSNGYLPRLAEFSRKYGEKGVTLIGVVPDADTTDKQLAAHAKEYAVPFLLLRDPQQRAASALGAKVTPEVVVLDDCFIVRYRGRIDDQYSARLKPRSMVTQHNLADAIEEILTGNDVRVAETKAFGCPIASSEPRKKAGSTTLTFHKDVVPILQKHCQGCHRPGQIGPFELTSFKSAAKWADLCLEEVKNRRMPPWKPAANPLLLGERSVPVEAIQALEQWIAQGMAEGDPKDAPPAVSFSDDWSFGKPDLILESPAETTVAASGPDLFQVQVFPTHFVEDKYIVAMEVRPGNPRVVHHTVQFIDTAGIARKKLADYQANQAENAPDHGPGYSVKMGLGFLPSPNAFLGGWAPGMLPKLLPDGVGQRLPRGADICVQFHFHRTGKRETDRTRIGVYFAKKPVTESFFMLPPNGLFWKIPAGSKDYKVDSSWRLTDEVTVHRLAPHMHLIGKDIELLIKPPGESERTLIRIPEWDYNWQEQYDLKEPLHLSAGTILRVRATYDNSADNPMNPSSPPRDVMLGEQTTNEMCFVFMGISTTRLLPPLLAPMGR